MSWRDHAACRGREGDLFFPVGTSGPAVQQIEDAKGVCSGCTVSEACLLWAIEVGADHGVWGGLTEIERRPWATRRRRHAGRGQPTLSSP